MSDDTNKPLFERFDRPYLPAVKIFSNGVEASEFSGFKDAPGIVKYLKTEKAKAVSALVWSVYSDMFFCGEEGKSTLLKYRPPTEARLIQEGSTETGPPQIDMVCLEVLPARE